ncbi:hypothetical protein Tco_0827014 [Tanacetum coccineum]
MGNEAKTASEDKVMEDLEENPMIEKPEEVLSKILKEGFDKTILLQDLSFHGLQECFAGSSELKTKSEVSPKERAS